MKRIILLGAFMAFSVESAQSAGCTAKKQKTKVADFGKTAMPIASLGVSLLKRDWLGAGLSQLLSHGLYPLNDKLEHKIGKKRPCGCDGAFPSGHMIMYASSSSYLHYRYGWEYGVPAYIATVYFAADRVNNKAHSWGDMLGTFAIVNLITYVVTPRFVEPVVVDDPRIKGISEGQSYLEYAAKKPAEVIPSLHVGGKNFLAGFRMKV